MQIGVVFPQTEIGDSIADAHRYATGAEAIGYRHLVAYEHVVGADPAVHTGWSGPYDLDSTFLEPLVLFGYLAAATTLELVPGIIIAPQRQTVLMAKQAATVDIACEGRFRFGVGLGWNAVEYEALGMDFAARGRRLDEQVPLLRRLWTERSITVAGEFDRITGAGLWPLPVQRPIPIWFGGGSPPALRRMGRLADGWFPMLTPGPDLDQACRIIADAAEAAGRPRDAVPMEGRITWDGDMDAVRTQAAQWRALGATHLGINTMDSGLAGVDAHLDVLARVHEAISHG